MRIAGTAGQPATSPNVATRVHLLGPRLGALLARTNAPGRRTLPRTAKALSDFIVEQEKRLSLFPPRNPERAAISDVLREVVAKAPWQALDRLVARAHNATLAGAVTFIADQLRGQRDRGFPPRHLANLIAGGCPDLHPRYAPRRSGHRRATMTLPRRVERALQSTAVRRILFGRDPGEPHGSVAAAERVVSLVTEVALSTVRKARRDLGRLSSR